MNRLSTSDPEIFVRRLSEKLAVWQERRTKEEAASLFGVSKSTYSRWIKGESSPDVRELSRVCETLGISPDALFGLTADAILGVNNSKNELIVHIPILDVSAGAGPAIDNDGAEIVAHLPFSVGFLRKLHIKPERVRAVRAHGDSMEPTVPDGMLVLINTAVSDLQDGRIYAIRAPDGLRLKRIQRQIDGSVMLISDNRDKYLPETLSREEAENLEVAGRAFWTERLL